MQQSDFIFQFDAACNSLNSQSFGRRLYLLKEDDQKHWLKMQMRGIDAEREHSFLHEIDIYTQINACIKPNQNILLNFKIFNPHHTFKLPVDILPHALSLQDSNALFSQIPDQLSNSELLNLFWQSLTVLENLHQMGYLHGDLKVEHFRLQGNQVALIDFEQTCLIEHAVNMRNSATPRYMAPELFHAKAKSIQSDIYALGIIWLEWLTQQRLQGKSYIDWAYLHCQRLNIELLTQYQYLKPVLEQMLMKKKEQRCANISEIKQRLSDFV